MIFKSKVRYAHKNDRPYFNFAFICSRLQDDKLNTDFPIPIIVGCHQIICLSQNKLQSLNSKAAVTINSLSCSYKHFECLVEAELKHRCYSDSSFKTDVITLFCHF